MSDRPGADQLRKLCRRLPRRGRRGRVGSRAALRWEGASPPAGRSSCWPRRCGRAPEGPEPRVLVSPGSAGSAFGLGRWEFGAESCRAARLEPVPALSTGFRSAWRGLPGLRSREPLPGCEPGVEGVSLWILGRGASLFSLLARRRARPLPMASPRGKRVLIQLGAQGASLPRSKRAAGGTSILVPSVPPTALQSGSACRVQQWDPLPFSGHSLQLWVLSPLQAPFWGAEASPLLPLADDSTTQERGWGGPSMHAAMQCPPRGCLGWACVAQGKRHQNGTGLLVEDSAPAYSG